MKYNILNKNNDKNGSENTNGFMRFFAGPHKGERLSKTHYITQAALIAAAYAALTIWLAPVAFGQNQIRIAEAFAVFPAFTPAAVPGLFIGCAIANTASFMGLPDLIFGSLATLISAQLTYLLSRALKGRSVWLAAALLPMPSVVINTFVIGAMLSILTEVPFAIAALGVAVGQVLSCYGLGVPLYLLLRGCFNFARAGAVRK